VGLSPEHEIPEARHAVAGFVTRMLGEKGEFIYPAKTQEAFKLKWGPQVIEPEYMAFEGKLRPSAVFQLMRVTRSI
jgi:lysylphosphatidylglycerol synthetase-like protein (DUF2156 family)